MAINPPNRKVRLVLGYISQDLADCMTMTTRKAGMSIECLHLSKKLPEFLIEATKADAVFVQWDGRANTGHDIISGWAEGKGTPKGPIYVVTTSKIRIDRLAEKPSRLLNITAWFDLPVETEKLNAELALLVPDLFDDFTRDLAQCGLRMLPELHLPRLRGKHLIDEIKLAWDARSKELTNLSRAQDPSFRKHILFFSSDQARTNELTTFLNENRFKYHTVIDELPKAMEFIRGHTTDCLVVWCGGKTEMAEQLFRMHLELRSYRRVPVVAIFPSEDQIKGFLERTADIFIDKIILYDRNRERFRTALLDALTDEDIGRSPKQILEELRATAKENVASNTVGLDLMQLEHSCTQLGSDPSKSYWADTERLMGYARLKEATKFQAHLNYYASRYTNFDARISIASARCQFLKEESEAAVHGFVSRLGDLDDLNGERIFRSGLLAARNNYAAGIASVLELWWNRRQTWLVDHQFYYIASRYCALKGMYALERSLLALAIRQDPLRNDYIEAYGQHLFATNHYGHAIKLCEYLLNSPYFPRRKAIHMLIQAHMKVKNNAAAVSLIEEQLQKTPDDKQLHIMLEKIQGSMSA